jgi:hypothetical protein
VQDDDSEFWGAPRRLGRFPSPGSSEARMGHCLAVMCVRPGGEPLLRRALELMQAAAASWWENASTVEPPDFWDRRPSRALMQVRGWGLLRPPGGSR